MKRYKMSKRSSKRDFRRNANKTRLINISSSPRRGGIRL